MPKLRVKNPLLPVTCIFSSSDASRRKKKLILAKLNVEHVEKRQEMKRKGSELKFTQRIIEAEMPGVWVLPYIGYTGMCG